MQSARCCLSQRDRQPFVPSACSRPKQSTSRNPWTRAAELASVGLTGVAAGIDLPNYRLYKQYTGAHKLTARIMRWCATPVRRSIRSARGQLLGHGGGFLAVRAVKPFADGALGSRGAAMLAPYSDDPHNRGLLFMPPAVLVSNIDKAFAKGYQVNIHAIGDAANHEVLDSFAAAYKSAIRMPRPCAIASSMRGASRWPSFRASCHSIWSPRCSPPMPPRT